MKFMKTQRIECNEEKSSRCESINRISKENTHREFWDNNVAELVGVPNQCQFEAYIMTGNPSLTLPNQED